MDAAACGDLDEVKRLLLLEPKISAELINQVDKDGKSAFHYACLNDDVNLLNILLTDGRVDVALTSRNGDNAFHMIALYSSLEALKALTVDGRVNINGQNRYLETPLHLCAGSGDKSAAKTGEMLLNAGASLTIVDKWKRTPIDVSKDNSENPLIAVFQSYLEDRTRCSEEVYNEVMRLSAEYKQETNRLNQQQLDDDELKLIRKKTAALTLFGIKTENNNSSDSSNNNTSAGIFGGIGGIKLRKTDTVLKTMFKANEGNVTSNNPAIRNLDSRTSLSKIIEFPGDLEQIKAHVLNKDKINPAGADAYGITALHKFASWNKTDYLDVLLPHLTAEEREMKCPDGKTAIHYAVEMASVAALKTLVAANVNTHAKNKSGLTVYDILNCGPPTGVIARLKNALNMPTK